MWAGHFYLVSPATTWASGELTGITISNTPVPVRFSLPITILPDGVDRSSKSPCSVASERNAAVVSYDALSRGDGFVDMPFLLKGLYPPSKVY